MESLTFESSSRLIHDLENFQHLAVFNEWRVAEFLEKGVTKSSLENVKCIELDIAAE